MMKRLLLSVLIFLPMLANADAVYIDGIYYNLNGNSAEVTKNPSYYNNSVEIPQSVVYGGKNYRVTSIGEYAFFLCRELTSVTIPNSVTSIGDAAFDGCSGLISVLISDIAAWCNIRFIGNYSNPLLFSHHLYMNDEEVKDLIIPNSVTSIGNYVFFGCSGLTSVTIPNSVTSIGDGAFHMCSGLTSVTIPNSVTSIGDAAFDGCSGLTSVAIGNSVTSIGYAAFGECSALTSILVSNGNPRYDSRNNCNAIIETSSNTLIAGCKNTIIPNSVSSIGDGAFKGCSSLTSVIIPNSVTSIGNFAFMNCNGLTSVTIPNSVTFIGDGAFYGCGLISVTIPYSVTTIGFNTFAICVRLTSVTIPNSVTSIGGSAFYMCSGLTSVTIPNSVTSIGDNAFYMCSGLTSVTIPNSVTSIGDRAFQNCSSLTSVTIPNSVTSIGDGAFYRCSSLSSVNSEILNPFYMGEFVFNEISSNATLQVPKGTKGKYKAFYCWTKNFMEIREAGEGQSPTTYILSIKSIGNGSALYDGTTIRNSTDSFTVEEGTNVTIVYTPDNVYLIKSLMVNNADETANISNNTYNVGSISRNTTVEVVFEEDSPKQLINGHEYVDLDLPSGRYWSTVNYGAKNPEDAGSYFNNSSINDWGEYWRTPTQEEFQELIDECEWTWTDIGGIKGFSIKGRNGNMMFLPAAGYYDYDSHIQNTIGIGSETSEYPYKNEVAYYWTLGGVYNVGDKSGIKMQPYSRSMLDQMPIRPISTVKNESVFTKDGLNYMIVSSEAKTVNIAKGNYGKVLEVPQSVTYPDKEWKIVGIDDEVLYDNEELSAIIWNPEVSFTNNVRNSNLLLYVKSANYAPQSIKNVVVNNIADNITLIDAADGNNFYCPLEFTAKSISYTHHYKMETGINESKGWETIALPFDVQRITHKSKGEIVPFANWKSGDSKKPFWLKQLGSSGWTDAQSIKAYTPYIISMPNNTKYKEEYKLNGDVTFSAENVKIGKTENLTTSSFNGRTFIPNFTYQTDKSYYALNVNNDYVDYQGNRREGSMFFIGLRDIHPFEAYMTTASGTRAIAIEDDMTTGIEEIKEMLSEQKDMKVYNLKGQLIKTVEGKTMDEVRKTLPAGIYIVNGQKLIIK